MGWATAPKAVFHLRDHLRDTYRTLTGHFGHQSGSYHARPVSRCPLTYRTLTGHRLPDTYWTLTGHTYRPLCATYNQWPAELPCATRLASVEAHVTASRGSHGGSSIQASMDALWLAIVEA